MNSQYFLEIDILVLEIFQMEDLKGYSAILDTHLETALPERLFHYTSPHGLLGIIENKELWASNVSFLNDSSEISQFVDCIKHELKERRSDEDINPSEYDFLEKVSNTYREDNLKYFFIASLSEDGDSLSQWRGYCPEYGGYCIGFPSIQLMNMAKAQGFVFAKCTYESNQKRQVALEIVNHYLEYYRSESKTKGKVEHNEIIRKGEEFWKIAMQIGGIFKDNHFRSEREWRVISPLILDPVGKQFAFNPTQIGIKPYFKFKLSNKEYPNFTGTSNNNKLKIIAGPTFNKDNSTVFLHYLAVNYFDKDCQWSISGVPYKIH